jgi:cell division protein FtsB
MTPARALSLSLILLLVLTGVGLGFGRGGVPQVISLRARLAAQDRANEMASERNRRLAAEVDDLRDGLDSIENRARSELGLIKSDEIMIVVAQAR